MRWNWEEDRSGRLLLYGWILFQIFVPASTNWIVQMRKKFRWKEVTQFFEVKVKFKGGGFWNHKGAARKKWFTLHVAEEYCYRMDKKSRGGQVYAAHVLLAWNWWRLMDRFHSCPQSPSFLLVTWSEDTSRMPVDNLFSKYVWIVRSWVLLTS